MNERVQHNVSPHVESFNSICGHANTLDVMARSTPPLVIYPSVLPPTISDIMPGPIKLRYIAMRIEKPVAPSTENRDDNRIFPTEVNLSLSDRLIS